MRVLYKKLLNIILLLVIQLMPLFAQNIAGGHKGNITSLIHNRDTIISAGEDGFIVIWNAHTQTAEDRLQLTSGSISAMAKHPLNNEICAVESAGSGQYRLSAWNYTLKEKLFSLTSSHPVTYINYSAGGSFIIAAGLNGIPLALLDPNTGKINSTPNIPAGNVTAAMTGRAERNMLFYHSSQEHFEGHIMYYDLASAAITGRFQAPPSLSNPIIFGNGRFLAGINSTGLVVIDAASGAEYDNFRNISRTALLCPDDEGFYCLNREGTNLSLYKFTLNSYGNLVIRERLLLSTYAIGSISSIAYNNNPVLANTDGRIFLLGERSNIIHFTFSFQTRITEINATNANIAVLSEHNELFFLPTNYNLLRYNSSLTLKNQNGYTRINAIPSSPYESGNTQKFILWQSANTRLIPKIVNADNSEEINLGFLLGRFPARAISATSDKILVLDTAGNITVFNSYNSSAEFTFSSIGAIDAVLVNSEYFILCRSVMSGNSPFLLVNYKTGETVPFSFPAEAGIKAYIGKSGRIYGAAVERNVYGASTIVYNISTASSAGADARIREYSGEAVHLTMAESSRLLAIANSDDGAAIYGEEIINFERSSGLPEKLLGSDDFFISLDSDGSICWHDNKTGKLLATFKLHGNRWTLKSDTEISGNLWRN